MHFRGSGEGDAALPSGLPLAGLGGRPQRTRSPQYQVMEPGPSGGYLAALQNALPQRGDLKMGNHQIQPISPTLVNSPTNNSLTS